MAALKSRYRHRSRWWMTCIALALALVSLTFFVTGSSANVAGSNFESGDGNPVVDGATNADWAKAPNASVTGMSVLHARSR